MLLVNFKDRIYKKPYKPDYMTALARDMRKNPTESERLLWLAMREKNFFGYHFRRQASYGRYIFDFYCPKKKLAIEIDGASHEEKRLYDKFRDEYVAASKIEMIRFSDNEVRENINAVLAKIEAAFV